MVLSSQGGDQRLFGGKASAGVAFQMGQLRYESTWYILWIYHA